MQVLRLVEGGVVDKLIAFDSLPERFFKNVEKTDVRLYGLPRHWAKFSSHHYVLEYKMVNKDKETWQAMTNFLKQVVDKTFRLMDKIEDMALPMANNSKESVGIEPEEIPIVPIPVEFQELPKPELLAPNGQPAAATPVAAPAPIPTIPAPADSHKCAECAKEFSGKQALRMHRLRKHSKEAVAA